MKLSNFLVKWQSLTKLQKSEIIDTSSPISGKAGSIYLEQRNFMDPMLSVILTDFSDGKPLGFVSLNHDFPQTSTRQRLLVKSLRSILVLLKRIFFEEEVFLVQSLEEINQLVECTLDTNYEILFNDEDIHLNIIDSCEKSHPIELKVQTFLGNVRIFTALVSYVFYNQIRILVRQRVNYSREIFNFESYCSIGLSDDRLLRNMLFMKNGKKVIGEFFKFQSKIKTTDSSLLGFEKLTYDQLNQFVNNLALHVNELWKIQQLLDIESLLLVYFSTMSEKQPPKDALSKVSKNFFKEFKMNYRKYDNVYEMFKTIYKFFELPQNQTIRTFIEFTLINLSEQLSEEQFNLALIIFREKNFVSQENLDKFVFEIQKCNDLIKFLFFLDTDNYRCIRTVREIQHKCKKFTEFAQRRIEKIIEKLKVTQNIQISIVYPAEKSLKQSQFRK
eukprot:403349349